jgi:hypothetical protein
MRGLKFNILERIAKQLFSSFVLKIALLVSMVVVIHNWTLQLYGKHFFWFVLVLSLQSVNKDLDLPRSVRSVMKHVRM